MKFLSRWLNVVCVCGMWLIGPALAMENEQLAPNSDPTYLQLRNLTLGSEAVSLSNVELKRDAATFRFKSGTMCFVAPVQGKVTGAVFSGEGEMALLPPLSAERKSLKLLTKEDSFLEDFNSVTLRFTDSTYDELKKAGTSAAPGCDAGLLRGIQNGLRHNDRLKYNLEGRILEDVLSTGPGGFFAAFVHGKKYNGQELFVIDPHGLPSITASVSPEEVEFATYDENKLGTWAAFHLAAEYPSGKATGNQLNSVVRIDRQQLDTTIEKSANLIGKATTTFVSQINGLRVVPFDLFGTLRVQNVKTADGQALAFIQENKNDDPDFFVILPRPLAAGDTLTITTTYAGKDAVSNEGNGNYFPIARHNWYPNNANSSGEYSSYEMTFRIPKGMKIAATGTLVSENEEGGQSVSVWKSVVPQTVAGFNFGRFKMEEVKLSQPEYLVQSYANAEPPDWVRNLLHSVNGEIPEEMGLGGPRGAAPVAMGNMSTIPMLKKALAEGQLSMQLYTDYFGAIPFKRLSVTQQTACNFGQSWPGLVWLPICSFFDTTVRHNLGIDSADRGYWKSVTAHEVAHQWWGHQVGYGSYRDQWMSEGFAEMSASLYIQYIEKNPKKFIEFWNDQRTMLLERNREGYRAADVGPLTMGYRLNNSKAGFNITRALIYPKGAYVLHMVRMMMWGRQNRDSTFKVMMQDFSKTYAGRAATTEDFKAIVEKHMTPDMQAFGNNMDWFFNEYVYGTAVPTYKLDYGNFEKDASGDVVLKFKVTQSGVDENFRMLVPIYLELADNQTMLLGRLRMTGNTSVEDKVPLKGLKDMPHKVLINYFDDVLAAN